MSAVPPTAAGLPLLILTGPTGSGKSAWAIELAATAPVEIVSVDSAQVYRGMDIGTAKPDASLRRRIAHHLIDICDPAERYSAGRFVSDALECIRGIHARRHAPLLVGGTMLYLRALLRGLAPLPQASPPIRRELEERAVRVGWPTLHAELVRLDPQAAFRIRPGDSQRIQRALEVCYATGKPLSQLQQATVSPLAGMSVRSWALAPVDRQMLHASLERRFHDMMAAGFLYEVMALRQRPDLDSNQPSMRAVGYRQLWSHLDGAYSLEEATRRSVFATRQLAKRQLTWMRSERSLQLLDPASANARTSWIRDVRDALRELGL